MSKNSDPTDGASNFATTLSEKQADAKQKEEQKQEYGQEHCRGQSKDKETGSVSGKQKMLYCRAAFEKLLDLLDTHYGYSEISELFHLASHHERNPENINLWVRKPGFSPHVAYLAIDSVPPYRVVVHEKGVDHPNPRAPYMQLLNELRDIEGCGLEKVLSAGEVGTPEFEMMRKRASSLPRRIYRGKAVYIRGWEFPLIQLRHFSNLTETQKKSIEDAIVEQVIGLPFHDDWWKV